MHLVEACGLLAALLLAPAGAATSERWPFGQAPPVGVFNEVGTTHNPALTRDKFLGLRLSGPSPSLTMATMIDDKTIEPAFDAATRRPSAKLARPAARMDFDTGDEHPFPMTRVLNAMVPVKEARSLAKLHSGYDMLLDPRPIKRILAALAATDPESLAPYSQPVSCSVSSRDETVVVKVYLHFERQLDSGAMETVCSFATTVSLSVQPRKADNASTSTDLYAEYYQLQKLKMAVKDAENVFPGGLELAFGDFPLLDAGKYSVVLSLKPHKRQCTDDAGLSPDACFVVTTADIRLSHANIEPVSDKIQFYPMMGKDTMRKARVVKRGGLDHMAFHADGNSTDDDSSDCDDLDYHDSMDCDFERSTDLAARERRTRRILEGRKPSDPNELEVDLETMLNAPELFGSYIKRNWAKLELTQEQRAQFILSRPPNQAQYFGYARRFDGPPDQYTLVSAASAVSPAAAFGFHLRLTPGVAQRLLPKLTVELHHIPAIGSSIRLEANQIPAFDLDLANSDIRRCILVSESVVNRTKFVPGKPRYINSKTDPCLFHFPELDSITSKHQLLGHLFQIKLYGTTSSYTGSTIVYDNTLDNVNIFKHSGLTSQPSKLLVAAADCRDKCIAGCQNDAGNDIADWGDAGNRRVLLAASEPVRLVSPAVEECDRVLQSTEFIKRYEQGISSPLPNILYSAGQVVNIQLVLPLPTTSDISKRAALWDRFYGGEDVPGSHQSLLVVVSLRSEVEPHEPYEVPGHIDNIDSRSINFMLPLSIRPGKYSVTIYDGTDEGYIVPIRSRGYILSVAGARMTMPTGIEPVQQSTSVDIVFPWSDIIPIATHITVSLYADNVAYVGELDSQATQPMLMSSFTLRRNRVLTNEQYNQRRSKRTVRGDAKKRADSNAGLKTGTTQTVKPSVANVSDAIQASAVSNSSKSNLAPGAAKDQRTASDAQSVPDSDKRESGTQRHAMKTSAGRTESGSGGRKVAQTRTSRSMSELQSEHNQGAADRGTADQLHVENEIERYITGSASLGFARLSVAVKNISPSLVGRRVFFFHVSARYRRTYTDEREIQLVNQALNVAWMRSHVALSHNAALPITVDNLKEIEQVPVLSISNRFAFAAETSSNATSAGAQTRGGTNFSNSQSRQNGEWAQSAESYVVLSPQALMDLTSTDAIMIPIEDEHSA